MKHVLLLKAFRQNLLLGSMAIIVLVALSGCNKKRSSSSPTAAGGAWLSSFTTVDGSITAPQTTGVIFGATAANGDMYLSGTSADSFVIRKSVDKGETWTTINSFGATSYGYSITIDSLGNIFAAGTANSSGYRGLILKSVDGGNTWSSSYEAQIGGRDTVITAITRDSDDNLYAVGYTGADSPANSKWITLKSIDHGGSWSVVDTYLPDGLRFNAPIGVLVTSSDKIYAWGISLLDGDGSQVRMSSDGGNTWTLIYENWHRRIGSIVEWSDGLVMSESYDETGEPTKWRILATADDFAHLEIIEEFSPEGSTGSYGTSLKVDRRGYLYANGYYTDDTYYAKVVLLATRGDGNWEIVDEYSPGASLSAFSSDIFFDSEDGVYYASSAETSPSSANWTIRKASVLSSDTFTPDPIPAGSDLDSPIPAGAKRIFITNSSQSGVFAGSEAAAIAAADAVCSSDSNKPLGAGTYKALFVNSARIACTTPNCSGGVSEHTDWVLSPTTQYVRRNGTVIGTSNSIGLFETFTNAISPYNNSQPWTGLSFYLDWTIQNDDPINGNNYCDGWTTSGGSGSTWSPVESDFSYVYWYNGLTCSTPSTLLCVEQ